MKCISEKRLERIKRLKLLDDDFAKIFFQNRDCARLVAEVILQETIEVVHHETEAIIEMIGGRSVEYDIFVVSDKEGIDIEIENSISRVIPMRVTYHQSVMLVHFSKPQMDFRDMKDIIVIFICSFDPFSKGEACYHIDSVVRETNEIFNKKVSAILVNGTYVGDDPLGNLVNDFRVNNPDDMKYELLKDEAKYYKETKEGMKHMCEIWEEEREEGREEGRAEGREVGRAEGREEGRIEELIQSIKNIMSNLNFSLEEAFNALNVEEEKREEYTKLVLGENK